VEQETANRDDRNAWDLFPFLAIVVGVLAVAFLERELTPPTPAPLAIQAAVSAEPRTAAILDAPMRPTGSARGSDASATIATAPIPRPRPALGAGGDDA
jgi:hypothetical protein